MQLQMTAPMDIGMEQHDASLGFGQDDVFDLTGAECGMRGNDGVALLTEDGYDMLESDESGNEAGSEEDVEVLNSDEEREKKLAGLEAELDGMYDAYQERLKERDAKFKVTEARKQNGLLEEWNGIKPTHSDNEGSDSQEQGGWDKMEEAKETAGQDSSSDESDEGDETPVLRQKRRPAEPIARSSKRVKLLTKLAEPKSAAQASRATQVWFGQDVFAGMDLDDVEDKEDKGISMDDEDEDEDDNWQDDVSPDSFCT
jgi:AdoMet-dependent rRNA methyltransferase SPB1